MATQEICFGDSFTYSQKPYSSTGKLCSCDVLEKIYGRVCTLNYSTESLQYTLKCENIVAMKVNIYKKNLNECFSSNFVS